MDEHMSGTDVREALTRLAGDGPAPALTAAGVIAAGRQRRHRHAYAVGGTSLAVAAVIAAAVVIPMTVGSRAPATTPAGGGVAASAQPATAAVNPPVRQRKVDPRGQAPVGTGEKTPSCPVMTDQQWRDHLAFEQKVHALLPRIQGTITSALTRADRACPGEAQSVWWIITDGARGGDMQGSASGPGPSNPDQYRLWQRSDPCIGYANATSTCSFTRHGDALVYLTHRSGPLAPPRMPGQTADKKPFVHEEAVQVIAIWADGSGAVLSESTALPVLPVRPALSVLPLTEQQMVEAALQMRP